MTTLPPPTTAVPPQSAPLTDGTAPPPPAEEHRPAPDLLKVVTSIGSPIALGTALLFYFGWVRSEEQARAFGADASVFEMSTQDYVLRSVNVLFFPAILLLLLGLLVVRVDRRLRIGSVPPERLVRLARALRWSWLPLLVLAVALLWVPDAGAALLPLWVTLAVAGPAYGAVLQRRAAGDGARVSPVALGLLATLVTVCLFWLTESMAEVQGKALADDIKARPGATLESVRVLSAKDLQLRGPGVTAVRLGGDESAYSYAYSGLFLLQRSGGKYFLVSRGWNRDAGRLFVLPDTPTMRLEFGRDGSRQRSSSTSP